MSKKHKRILSAWNMCNLGTINFNFHKNTTKDRKFQLTNMLVQLNFQDLEEFHPTTGFRKALCFYLVIVQLREENKHNNTNFTSLSKKTQKNIISNEIMCNLRTTNFNFHKTTTKDWKCQLYNFVKLKLPSSGGIPPDSWLS